MNQSISSQTIGVILIVTGIGMRYFIAKRRFNRRAITGAQLFHSYEQSLFIRFFEWMTKLVGILLILIGAILLIMRYVRY